VNTKTHSDIKPDSALMRLFPESWRPYALLARLDRPIGIWLLLLPGWWAIMLAGGGVLNLPLRGWWMMFVFLIGAVVMRAAGCVINDLWDRKLDAKIERTRDRPLASGAVSPRQAALFLLVLLWAGFFLLMLLSPVAIVLGFLSLPLIATYPLMKRFIWWPQAYLGLTFNFSALMGWASMTNDIGFAGFILYLSAMLWTLGYDTIYAHQDAEDDALVGIRSTALHFGDQSRRWVTGFYGASFAALAIVMFLRDFSFIDPLLLLPAGAHLMWQIKIWDQDDPHSSLRVFKSNRDYGLLVFLALCLAGTF
jgi:4-hydroxybenzoate polyprenyltransferase